MLIILAIVYVLLAAFFLWDVHRSFMYVHRELVTIGDKVWEYSFAILWPVAVFLGVILVLIDFAKSSMNRVK